MLRIRPCTAATSVAASELVKTEPLTPLLARSGNALTPWWRGMK